MIRVRPLWAPAGPLRHRPSGAQRAAANRQASRQKPSRRHRSRTKPPPPTTTAVVPAPWRRSWSQERSDRASIPDPIRASRAPQGLGGCETSLPPPAMAFSVPALPLAQACRRREFLRQQAVPVAQNSRLGPTILVSVALVSLASLRCLGRSTQPRLPIRQDSPARNRGISAAYREVLRGDASRF